jgi:murein DD-endopeptidase MepM/ murein hydrolase activator NlpD
MSTVSQSLIDFVKSFEGPFIPKAKWDYAQYTNGFGTKASYLGEPITVPEAERRLKVELQESINRVLSIAKVTLNNNQLAALASLDFNSGSIIKYKKMVAAINSSNFNEAANQFLDINKTTTGEVLPGLTKRRKAEAALFLGKSSGVNNPINQSVNTAGSLATNAGQSVINGINSIGAGIQSALLTGQNCPPPAYTQQDRIIYPGCLSKSQNPIFGNSLGSGPSAPAINAIGTAGNRGVPTQAAGNSEPYSGELKPGGLICPVKGAKISSPYGWRRHPITGDRRFHNGIDFAVGTGTPVYAAADGIVKSSGWMGGYGNTIVLTHSQLGADTLYAHNSRLAVTKGQQVKQGQVICYVGSTGNSTGPHSHVEVLLNGTQSTDPAKYIKC